MKILFHAGMFLAGSSAVYAVVVACSGGGSGGVPIGTADAQNCPDCTGLVRTVSPDTDPAQAVGGTGVVEASGPYDVEVATGPFFLTDVVVEDFLRIGTAPVGQGCIGFVPFKVIGNSQYGGGESLHGARIFINANETLCFGYSSSSAVGVTFRWSGFRPY